MNQKLIKPTLKEDSLLTTATSNDVDNIPLTNKQWNQVKATLKRGLNRP
jgi:glucokinase